MEMKYKAENRQLTITLSGELDHHAARELMESIDRLLEQVLPARTLLDLGELSFMDSSGIAVILRARQKMQLLDGSLLVRGASAQARRVLDAAGVNRLVTIK